MIDLLVSWCDSFFDFQMKLSKERDSLAMTARKLGRDLAKVTFFMPFIVKIYSNCLVWVEIFR